MKEKDIEAYLVWSVEMLGGAAYKFRSPSNRGVADRVVCLPDGQTWFVEMKTQRGRLAPLQKVFAFEMETLKQNYVVLWSTEQVDAFIARISRKGR